MADRDALPFPLAAGYTTLALNGAKGGATKYLCLQYLNYARWTSQQFSCNLPRSSAPQRGECLLNEKAVLSSSDVVIEIDQID